MMCVLRNDGLKVSDEETVLQALKNWFEADPIPRHPRLASLLPLIRFNFLDNFFISQVLIPNKWFSGYDDLWQSLTHTALYYQTIPAPLKKAWGMLSSMPTSWTEPRPYYNNNPSEFLFDVNIDTLKWRSPAFYFRGIAYFIKWSIGSPSSLYIRHCQSLTVGRTIINKQPWIYNIRVSINLWNFYTQAWCAVKVGDIRACPTSGRGWKNLDLSEFHLADDDSPFVHETQCSLLVTLEPLQHDN
eukprot:TRINITY_DN15258_c0_g1_i1.p1 TRINITY_DN15258_c0_g1~~TRINITY_DN15258_c0_g1_i1.p1  ORF type:complete len:244 (-),score=29.09 TRINITY_DN15258_c0_g1_i1:17-748(-)